MRLISSLVLIGLASSAHAGSVQEVKSLPRGMSAESITVIGCVQCPPPAPKKNAYVIPAIPPGQQKVELKMVHGEQKIFRTDAWIGGSPVTYISTPTKDELAALQGPKPNEMAKSGDGVDRSAKTAAVPSGVNHPIPATAASLAPVTAGMEGMDAATMVSEPAPKPLDTSGFTLRTQ